MNRVVVNPVSDKKEFLIVLSVSLTILFMAVGAIFVRKGKGESVKLKPYQISAFSELNPKEQTIFTLIFADGFEIDAYNRNSSGKWPSIDTLEAQYISPFVHDISWEQNGKIMWSMKNMDKGLVRRAAYLGRATTNGCGTFLLIMENYRTQGGTVYYNPESNGQPFRIWYSKSGTTKVPEDITDAALIAGKWKELVPFKGKDELKKLGRG